VNDSKRGRTSLKIISVVLAVLLWLFVTNENIIITKKEISGVKLNHVNLGEGLKASYTDRVAVEIIGTPKKASDINAYIDLRGLKPGVHTVPVKVSRVSGARVTSIRPDQVKVQIFETRENVFPVAYEIETPLPSGYKAEGIITVPDKCLVKGPEEVIERISSLTVFLNLGGLTRTSAYTLPVKAIDGRGRVLSDNLTIIPDKVKVYVVVGQEKSLRKLPVVPDLTGKLPDGYVLGEVRVDPPQVTQVTGSGTTTPERSDITTAPVSLDGRTASFIEEIRLVVPQGWEVFPERVRVFVQVNTTGQEGGI